MAGESIRSLPLRVLLVEDEMVTGLAFAQEFALSGYEVIGPYAKVANVLPLATRPDAAVVDHRLADGTSDAVVLALREQNVPCLIVSASGGEASDGTAYLSKPVKPITVVSAVDHLLGRTPRPYP